MSGIIKEYSIDGENSIVKSESYKIIEDKVERIFKAEFPRYLKEKESQIRELIKYKISSEVLRKFVAPWVIAVCLSKIIEEMNIAYEKESANSIIDAIKILKKFLPKKPPDRQCLVTLATSREPDLKKAHAILDDLADYEKTFTEMDFKNGDKINPAHIRRYAIYALFYLGEQIGLKKKKNKKPTDLNKLVNIVTGLDYKLINTYYSVYKETTLKATAGNNHFLYLIFNPHIVVVKITT